MNPDIEIAKRVYEKAHQAALTWVRARSGDCHMSVDGLELDWRNSLILFFDRPSGGGIAMRPKYSIPLSFVDESSSVISADGKERYEIERDASIKKSNRVEELRRSEVVQELSRLGYVLEPYRPYFCL